MNDRNDPRAYRWDRTPDDEESADVESESLRPDRRATVAGSAIVGHSTRESFMRATGKATLIRGMRTPAPIPSGISCAEARAGLLAAFACDTSEVVLASDAEIRAASRCADTVGSGRYRQ